LDIISSPYTPNLTLFKDISDCEGSGKDFSFSGSRVPIISIPDFLSNLSFLEVHEGLFKRKTTLRRIAGGFHSHLRPLVVLEAKGHLRGLVAHGPEPFATSRVRITLGTLLHQGVMTFPTF